MVQGDAIQPAAAAQQGFRLVELLPFVAGSLTHEIGGEPGYLVLQPGGECLIEGAMLAALVM